jgi:glycosyltransferase involved in cell wall biosynthesis
VKSIPSSSTPAVDFTIFVATYNRAGDLREMLESVCAQDTGGGFTFEVVIVDNNSSDDTRAVVERMAQTARIPVRYLFEARPGRGFALNRGLPEVRGRYYAIVDDDLILPPDYLRTVHSAARAHDHSVAFFGGRVLPLWRGDAPPWLDRKHWSAIAMADYGESELICDIDHPITLLAGIYRTEYVRAVGGYHDELGVTKDRIGGTEDADLQSRLRNAGWKGFYFPQLFLYHKVEPHRLTKKYHRKWHTGHGANFAVMRQDEIESSSHRFLDIPGHVFRGSAISFITLLALIARGRRDEAFLHETRLRFFWGFSRQRFRDFNSQSSTSVPWEIARFARSLGAKLTRPLLARVPSEPPTRE